MRKYQKILALLCIAVFLLTSCGTVLGKTENVKVTLNGNAISFDVPPQIINNRTMVPLRAVFEAMGALVNWEPYQKCISVESYGQCVQLIAGENIISIYGKNGKKEVWLDSVPCIINGRTLVPVRAISEALGADVRWNDASKTVEIEYQQISRLPLNSEQFSILNGYWHLLEDFEKEDISRKRFAIGFIETPLNNYNGEVAFWLNEEQWYYNGSREERNAEYRLAFGCDMPYFTENDLPPNEIVLFNGKYAVVSWCIAGYFRYATLVYDHAEKKTDGSYDLFFAQYSLEDWYYFGDYVYNISLADNENGFIMNSGHEYRDKGLQETATKDYSVYNGHFEYRGTLDPRGGYYIGKWSVDISNATADSLEFGLSITESDFGIEGTLYRQPDGSYYGYGLTWEYGYKVYTTIWLETPDCISLTYVYSDGTGFTETKSLDRIR